MIASARNLFSWCDVLGRNDLAMMIWLDMNSIGRRRCGRRGVRWLEPVTLGCHWRRGVGLLGILACLLGVLALGRVTARGDTARGIVGGRDLGFSSSVTRLGEVGGKLG